MIHRMGWTLVRHPDGTTMAWNRDKSKDLARLSRVSSSQTYGTNLGQAEVRQVPDVSDR
jgi:hypothetical protein